jgi:Tfp pilus assembly protein PilF
MNTKHPALIGGLIAATVLLIYTSTLQHGFVVWDDDTLVTRNPIVQTFSLENIARAFSSYDPELYVPLTIVSFQIEHALVGNAPLLYHLDNILLHILCVILLWRILEEMKIARAIAVIGALIFAVHPLNTETVAWVSARKDLLATAFAFTSILLHLQWRRNGQNTARWASLACGIAAMLSKAVAVPLPLILALLDWHEHRKLRDAIPHLFPMFIGSIVVTIIAVLGKTTNIGALTMTETILLATKSAVFLLAKWIWPQHLSIVYVQTTPITFSPEFLLPSIVIACMIAGAVMVISHSRTPLLCLAIAGLFLLPTCANFWKAGQIYVTSDRYAYLPQLGLILFLASAASWWIHTERKTQWAAMVALIPIIMFGWTAHARSLVWADSEALFRAALAENDASADMHFNLGVVLHQRGDREGAKREYDAAIARDPTMSKAHNNLGVLAREEGDTARALAAFRAAIDANATNVEAINNVGTVLLDRGDTNGAIAQFQAAIAIDETFVQAYVNLGSAYGKQGRYEEGLREFARAAELDPSRAERIGQLKMVLEHMTRGPNQKEE